MKQKSIEELREELARQILEIAINDENPQYKLDAYKAINVKPAKIEKATPVDAMTIFQQRVSAASGRENGSEQQAEIDC
jgi:hypothetical protein